MGASNYLTTNVSGSNLKQCTTQPVFELGDSQVKISKIDSKPKVLKKKFSHKFFIKTKNNSTRNRRELYVKTNIFIFYNLNEKN